MSSVKLGGRRIALKHLLDGVVVIAFGLVPVFTNDQYVLDVLTQAGIYVLLACGLNVVVALAGLLDLGFVAFWAVGSYTAAVLASPQHGLSVPFLLLIPAGVVVTSIFAAIIGIPTLRLRGDYLAIVTLGFGEIVRITLVNADKISGGPAGIQAIHRPAFAFYTFTYLLQPYYYLILSFCLLALFIGYRLRTSKIGIAWQALRDDELAARTSGIWPLAYYVLAFAIGASFASVAGILFATKQVSVTPDSFTADESFLILGMVVLGGLSGRFWPVAISAIVITVLPEGLRDVQQYRLVIFGLMLVGAMILREHWKPATERLKALVSNHRAIG
jgi:branched-chain amino acid transport system permease protein